MRRWANGQWYLDFRYTSDSDGLVVVRRDNMKGPECGGDLAQTRVLVDC